MASSSPPLPDAAAKLLDFSQPFDVPLLDATINAFYGAGSNDEVGERKIRKREKSSGKRGEEIMHGRHRKIDVSILLLFFAEAFPVEPASRTSRRCLLASFPGDRGQRNATEHPRGKKRPGFDDA